jgi:hypothetical protein
LDGRAIRLPENPLQRPLAEYLDYHSSKTFQP